MDYSHQTWAGGGPAEIVAEDVVGVLMSSREESHSIESTGTPAEGEGCMQTIDRAEEWLMGCQPTWLSAGSVASKCSQVQRTTHCYTP